MNLRSPYRAVYDARRARTDETHTEWPDWHRHKDAMRVTAKQIVKDLWRVSRGHEALLGGLNLVSADTPVEHERATNVFLDGDLPFVDTLRRHEAVNLLKPNPNAPDTLSPHDGLTPIDGDPWECDTPIAPEAVTQGAA